MSVARFLVAAMVASAAIATPALAQSVEPFEMSRFELTRAEGGPVLVRVESAWCGTCTQQARVLERLFSGEDFARLSVFRLDIDSQRAEARLLGAMTRSTLIVFRDGVEIARVVGDTRPDAIAGLLERAL